MVVRKLSGMILGCALVGFPVAAQAKDLELKSDVQKASYGIGQRIGQSMKAQGVDVDVDALAASIKDVLEGKPSRLKEEEVNAAMAKMQETVEKKVAELAKANKAVSDKFLEENKKNAYFYSIINSLQEIVSEYNNISADNTLNEKQLIAIHQKIEKLRNTIINGM